MEKIHVDVYQHYNLFNKQHPQFTPADANVFAEIKSNVTGCITHVMDCECYIVNKKWYLREVSVFDLKTNELYMYQIYYFANEVSYNKSMAYQINVVHGLPLIRGKVTNDFFRCSNVLFFLSQHFQNSNTLVACKGGTIEYKTLKSMNVKSINIEILGCPKYENLLSKYNIEHIKCCKYHKSNLFHCSGHEVEVFTRFINEIKG